MDAGTPMVSGQSRASMEPLFFKAENPVCLARRQVDSTGFNGAAFFQSGKSFVPSSVGAQSRGFNGAAFFQSGKFSFSAVQRLGSGASMEPLFFKAENKLTNAIASISGRSFNGAAFFQSGKCLRHSEAGKSARRFNGAAFFQSGKCASGAARSVFRV